MITTTGSTPVLATDLVSQRRTLSVSSPAENDRRLPGAAIVEGNVIDLSTIPGNAHVTLPPWIFAAPGQGVWLWITYDSQTIEVLSAHVVTAAEVLAGVNAMVPRSELDGVEDGTILVVHAAVSFDGSTSRPAKGHFPLNPYVLRTGGTGGNGTQLDERFVGVPPGTSARNSYELPSKTMSVTASDGASFIQIYEPTAIGLSLPRTAAMDASFELVRPAWLINLHYDAPIYRGGSRAYFYDISDMQIGERGITEDDQSVITYAAPPAQRIKRVRVFNNDGVGAAMLLRRISGCYDVM